MNQSYHFDVTQFLPGVLALLIALIGLVGATNAADQSAQADLERQFEQHVRPILSARCVKCHGRDKQEGELRLDSRKAMLAGGDSGPAIVPGEVDSSLLVEAIRHESLEMPPTGALPEPEIRVLERWIETVRDFSR